MSEHAVAAQESHKATGCTDCVQPVFVWILKCSGEPCSPLRVRCTRLHALRAKLNTQFMLYQNILYKHKYSSSGRPMNAPTGLRHLLNLFYINSVPLLACVRLTPLYFLFFNF